QAKVAAKKEQQEQAPRAQEQAQKQEPAEQGSESESLGEVARRYRRKKAERQAEEASKKKYTPFEYELAHPTVASPKTSIAPAPVIRSSQPDFSLPSFVPAPIEPRGLPKVRGNAKARISPFQPRPSYGAPPPLRRNPTGASPT